MKLKYLTSSSIFTREKYIVSAGINGLIFFIEKENPTNIWIYNIKKEEFVSFRIFSEISEKVLGITGWNNRTAIITESGSVYISYLEDSFGFIDTFNNECMLASGVELTLVLDPVLDELHMIELNGFITTLKLPKDTIGYMSDISSVGNKVYIAGGVDMHANFIPNVRVIYVDELSTNIIEIPRITYPTIAPYLDGIVLFPSLPSTDDDMSLSYLKVDFNGNCFSEPLPIASSGYVVEGCTGSGKLIITGGSLLMNDIFELILD